MCPAIGSMGFIRELFSLSSAFKNLQLICNDRPIHIYWRRKKEGIPSFHRHDLHTSYVLRVRMLLGTEKNPMQSLHQWLGVSDYHCVCLTKVITIAGLFQLGSGWDSKAWGFMACGQLTQSQVRTEPRVRLAGWETASLWFEWWGFAGCCGPAALCHRYPSRCILAFSLLTGFILNVSCSGFFDSILSWFPYCPRLMFLLLLLLLSPSPPSCTLCQNISFWSRF